MSADRIVTVCSSCYTEACWQGWLYCEDAKTAGAIDISVRPLADLKENPCEPNAALGDDVWEWALVDEFSDITVCLTETQARKAMREGAPWVGVVRRRVGLWESTKVTPLVKVMDP